EVQETEVPKEVVAEQAGLEVPESHVENAFATESSLSLEYSEGEEPASTPESYQKALEALSQEDFAERIKTIRDIADKFEGQGDEYFVKAIDDQFGQGVGRAI